MYEEKRKIELMDVDYQGHAKPDFYFERFTQLATDDAYVRGYYTKEMEDTYGWVVSKQTLTINEPLNYQDEVTFKTKPGKGSHVIFPRLYIIEREGKEVARCISQWTLIDLKHRLIIPPKKLGLTMEAEPIKDRPARLSPLEDAELVSHYTPLYSDIDLNGHLNNARYLKIVSDLIPLDFYEDHLLKKVTIYYKKELMPHNTMDIYIKKEDLTYYFEGKIEDETSVLISMTFK